MTATASDASRDATRLPPDVNEDARGRVDKDVDGALLPHPSPAVPDTALLSEAFR